MQAEAISRRLVATFLACLLPLPVGAQAPATREPVHVRITGVDTYEIPGVIKVDRDRVAGRPAVTTDHFIQFAPSDGTRVLTVLRPGGRVTGRPSAIADGLLEFTRDGESRSVSVPLDAIVKIEVARVPPSRAVWTTTGVFSGIGAFLLITSEFLNACGDEGGCGGGAALFGLSIGGGIAVAGSVASLGRTRWHVVAADELAARLDPPRNPNTLPGAPGVMPDGPSP
jgi:hypothetical protein